MAPPDSQPDTEALAKEVVRELDPGQIIDNKVILSRRQLVAIAGSGLGAGALAALGVDEAAAQAAGQQGTASSPNDMFAYNLDVQNGGDFNGNPLNNVGTLDAEDISAGTTLSLENTQETIASGSIPASAPFITVRGEGNAADDLTDMTGGADGDIVILKYGGENITVVDNGGETGTDFLLSSDFTLDNGNDKLTVIYDRIAGHWNELSRSNNA